MHEPLSLFEASVTCAGNKGWIDAEGATTALFVTTQVFGQLNIMLARRVGFGDGLSPRHGTPGRYPLQITAVKLDQLYNDVCVCLTTSSGSAVPPTDLALDLELRFCSPDGWQWAWHHHVTMPRVGPPARSWSACVPIDQVRGALTHSAPAYTASQLMADTLSNEADSREAG
jgi:hypothetical protein